MKLLDRILLEGMQDMNLTLTEYCDKAQNSLFQYFWEEQEGVLQNHYPVRETENWIYWWHAHALDCLIDGYVRTSDPEYLTKIKKEYIGTFTMNGQTFLHNWYDDMEWMALAQLRLWDATGEETYKEQVMHLWEDIKTAWNEQMGGGMAWKKDQTDYKNTPANAPAAILAFRLYQRFHAEEDLHWGTKILDWNIKNLVDPVSGMVWDGKNRLGDGKIDYEWNYTYNPGVVIGALVELYKINRSKETLDTAVKIAREAKRFFADAHEGVLPYEGVDDCGLFKGIFIRYLYLLIEVCPELKDMKEMILFNAHCVIEKGMNENGLIGGSWEKKERESVDLAQHLSGIMLLEAAVRLR